jgi:hypothetical protein
MVRDIGIGKLPAENMKWKENSFNSFPGKVETAGRRNFKNLQAVCCLDHIQTQQ